ncbi:hypothetical protein H5410_058870 [Solanum commersonii]|uniref:Uncharacterized protein n=1 Tax=Solanum commersonii TaxID=4109 RepID=A0A9J5W176_SOLCO|nr:hypothetical protein H5410_058870 [Solanum commersonii]
MLETLSLAKESSRTESPPTARTAAAIAAASLLPALGIDDIIADEPRPGKVCYVQHKEGKGNKKKKKIEKLKCRQKIEPAASSSFLRRSLNFMTSARGSTKLPPLSLIIVGSPTNRAAELADLWGAEYVPDKAFLVQESEDTNHHEGFIIYIIITLKTN